MLTERTGMTFNTYNQKMQKHLREMVAANTVLYTVAVDQDVLWNTYLDSFPPGTNEVFRKRREFDCSCCRHFVKRMGHVVAIKDGKLLTIWDFAVDDDKFTAVNAAMKALITGCEIENVLVTSESTCGTERSLEQKEGCEVIRWEHFFHTYDKRFVVAKAKLGETLGNHATLRATFERALTELDQQAVETVLDLIGQNSLYKGEEWQAQLNKFLTYQKAFKKLGASAQKLFCWTKMVEAGPVVSKIRNTSIGTLLVDLTNGVELDEAVCRYEKITAPSNYKRPKEIFTARMVEDAEKLLTQEGLLESLPRRFAVLDDISVNNILFANRDAMKQIKGSVFDDLKKGKPTKSFSKAEEINIADFIKDVLPGVSYMEAMPENRHVQNFVSLIAPQNKDSKSLFKWDNGFSWSYNGNVTDSMKERVKAAGGRVEGCLRFSIQWNEEGDNQNDFDAHCIGPDGHIYYVRKMGFPSHGTLDVDIIHPEKDQVAVENIIYPDLHRMYEGKYQFFVNCYSDRGGRSGFRAEIEFDGQIFQFDHSQHMRTGDNQVVAEVEYKRLTGFKMVKSMDSTQATRTAWGLTTGQFQPVSVLMYSPNYWNAQDGIGHRHYFFMLRGCKSEETPNGFYNEFVREEYMKHKRVFAALGGKMRVEPSDDQLSGIGFSATKRNDLTLKVEGNFSRVLSLKF